MQKSKNNKTKFSDKVLKEKMKGFAKFNKERVSKNKWKKPNTENGILGSYDLTKRFQGVL